jgi:TrmH family RNA methyltransferase
MPLTSLHNPQLQKLRRAVETGSPLEGGLVAAEGPHLLAEALGGGWPVEHVFYSPAALDRHPDLMARVARHRIEMTEVAERAFKAISGTEQNQGVVALLRPPVFTWNAFQPSLPGCRTGGPLVILDGIQDPGNAGTIVRSAEAFGAAGVVFTSGCVRVSNGKMLRAAAGSLFRVPFLENVSSSEVVRNIGKRRLFALAASGRVSLAETDLRTPFALVVGNEGRGVSEAFLKASQTLSIPTQGVESLNAAIACSITLFEAWRQST